MLKWISSQFDLSIVRARSALRAALFNFAFVATVTAMKSATNALYLARRTPTDLPYLYLATALVVTVTTIGLARRLASLSAKPVLRRSLFVWAGLLGVLSTLAALDVRASLGVLYVAGEAYATALSVLFWARLGEVFDVRAGKRVFGGIAAAGMAGAALGGMSVKVLAPVLPSVVWCFLAAITLLFLNLLIGSKRTPGSVRRERVSFASGLKYAALGRFPRTVAALVLLFSVQTAAIDYVFRMGTHRFEQGNEASMAAMFGVLNAVVGVAAIGFQSALTAKLLSRFGVFVYLAIVPALCVGTALWSLAIPMAFAPLFVLKALEMMASYSINQPGLQLLYNPIPPAVRGPIRAVVDGAVKKLGGAVGGIVLLLVGSMLGSAEMIGLVIVIGLLVLLLIRQLRPIYLQALEEKLGGKERRLPVLDPSERATREKLISTLSGAGEHETLAAISVLDGADGFDFTKHIGALIVHPSERVRFKAVELIERSPDPAYAPFLESVLRAPGDRPKAQAGRALALVSPEKAKLVLSPFLEAPPGADRGLLEAAIAALYTVERSESAPLAAERALQRLIERADQLPWTERRQVVRLLGSLGPGPYAKQLAVFVEDSSFGVRKAAIEAAGVALDPVLPPVLVRHLGERALQRDVREALAAYGDEAIPLLERTMNDRRIPVGVRVQVPRVLRLIGTSAAANSMLFSNIQDDAYLRYVIIEELARMRRMYPSIEINVEHNNGAALRRLRAYTHYRPIAEDLLLGGESVALLHRAVSDRVNQNREAALRLLGLVHGTKTMDNALVGFRHGERTAHADAVEIVDVALAKSPIRDQILSHLEPGPPVGDASRAKERARQLAEGRDMLLALIAAESLRRLDEEPPEIREPTSGEPLMPKSLIDRLFLLQNVQPFRDLSIDDLAAVAAIAIPGHAEPRDEVYREGEPGDSMYVIISGEIHLLSKGRPLLDLYVGDSFGQTSILDGGARPVTAKAGDLGADFMRIERQAFIDLMADRPELMTGMLAELAARIRELIQLNQDSSGPDDADRRAQLRGGASSIRPESTRD